MSHPRAWITAAVSTAVAAALLAPTVTPADAAPTTPSVVGAQTAGDTLFPHQGNGGYDVSHYDLAIAWATSNVITATATITATTTQQPLSQFSLDLEGLTVSAVTVNGTAAAKFDRIATGGKFKLVVDPATPVSGEFTTKVTYSGTPVTHTDPDGSKEGWVATTGLASGAVALNEPVGAMTWYPNNNTPKDKATFTTKLTVPYSTSPLAANRVAVSNGVLASTTIAGSTRTFTWNQPKQQATYLAMVGIGQYTASESDVALTTGTTHEWSYADPSAAGSTQFNSSRAKLSSILRGIEKYYGPYPGSSTGLVLDVSSLGYALETQDRPYFENSIDEATLIHEIAHQWFGDAVSPADWSDVWLNEGPATFIETQIAADLNGDPSTQDTYYSTWNSSSATSAMWTTPSAGFTDSSQLFDSHVYTRGAIALEALRSALGDQVFAEVMRSWQETYGGGSATTAQFIDVAEEVSGYDLTAFFQAWIYGTTKPTAWPVAYELSLASTPASGTAVDQGSAVSFTLTARNSGKVPTGSSTVEIDAAALLANGTLGDLPTGVTRSGSTLVWDVPATAVSGTASTTISATLDHASGGALAVRARGRTLGADCGTCSSTLTIRDAVLTSADPVVGGTPRVGETVTALTHGWTPGTTFTYQWLLDGEPIAGATATTYSPVSSQVDHELRVVVTGSQPGYTSVTRTSAPVTVTAAGAPVSPTPTITGTPRVGQTLTAVPGDWSDEATLSYQWGVNGSPVVGATSTTFTPRPEDLGDPVTVTVTGTRASGVTARTSEPVVVLDGVLDPTPTPTISGQPRTARTIAAVPGTWDSSATLTYQWLVDGVAVEGETAPTYVVRPTDPGKPVTVAVTGTRPGFTTVTRTSAPVTAALSTQTRQPRPIVKGRPLVGRTLHAYAGAHDTGVRITFKWYVGSTLVSGATTSTFKVRPRDRGKVVRVLTRASKLGYTTVSKYGPALRVR